MVVMIASGGRRMRRVSDLRVAEFRSWLAEGSWGEHQRVWKPAIQQVWNLRYALRTLRPRHLANAAKPSWARHIIQVQRVESPVVFHGDVDLPVEECPLIASFWPTAKCPTSGVAGPSSTSKPSRTRVPKPRHAAREAVWAEVSLHHCAVWAAPAWHTSRSACPARRPRPFGVR